jgi:flagella basal body P-ring formation protein FlgA
MIGTLTAIAAGAAIANPGIIVFHDNIRKSAPVLTLGDVADLTQLPVTIRARAASLVLVDGAMARPGMTLSHHLLASRTRALMPLLGPQLDQTYSGALRLNAMAPVIAASGSDFDAVVVGESVTIRLHFGIYTIERNGRALQSAKSGERFFVRTSGGVISALCCGGVQ